MRETTCPHGRTGEDAMWCLECEDDAFEARRAQGAPLIARASPPPAATASEFKALLAVARAAEDHSHAEVEPTPDGSDETCPICRALARLARASRGET